MSRLQITGGPVPEPAEPEAAQMGITPLRACVMFNRPFREVWAAYVYGEPEGGAAIGRPDRWGCWWASREDLEATFGAAFDARQVAASMPAHADRTAARIARRAGRAGAGR